MIDDVRKQPAVIRSPDGRAMGKIEIQRGQAARVNAELQKLLGPEWGRACEEEQPR